MSTNLREVIQPIVQGLITDYTWSLISKDELIDQVYALALREDEHSPSTIRTLTLGCYSERLFQIVNATGSKQEHIIREQNRAFEELSAYLYPIALKQFGDSGLARELVQDALVRIWKQRNKCKEPRAFLKFCLLRLLHAKTYHLRDVEKSRREEPLSEPKDDDSTQEMEPKDDSVRQPESQSLCEEAINTLLARYQQLHRERPRAKRWLEAVYLTEMRDYFEQAGPLTDEEIAMMLETNLTNLYSLRSKGKRLLRDDEEMRDIRLQASEYCGRSAE